ncbi:hypothetical protein OVY01_04040 [Robbsia sp. Bb-Pol-6]|uniref:Uncharacterized protein n=1 Tax=Robbsia betulipollinis TaxID=2981849 RepID=A0ABT3ZIS5_9BURK|nr:hypothetical protein [Robbsia betulipollinis]MCY0386423.1 hypothetical protein [Robbsia betulipollinis]
MDAERFVDVWGADMAMLIREAWPGLRHVGARVIDAQPGFLLTAARHAAAPYAAPLDVFLFLSPAGLVTFAQDDLRGYARFTANLRGLAALCGAFEADLPSGSQRAPRMQRVPFDAFIAPGGPSEIAGN